MEDAGGDTKQAEQLYNERAEGEETYEEGHPD
jgi:hypothetical protein